MYKTAVILASGKGSRMNDLSAASMPKHLRVLPNGQTIVGRVAESLAPVCDRMICTILSEEHRAAFEKAFERVNRPVEIVVKETPGEFTEIPQVSKLIDHGNIIQTNGDLITADGVLADFVLKYGDRNHFFRGREGNPENKRGYFDIFNSRISVVPQHIFREFSSTTKLKALLRLGVSLILGRVAKVPTLFNIDTPQDYQKACEYFRSNLRK